MSLFNNKRITVYEEITQDDQIEEQLNIGLSNKKCSTCGNSLNFFKAELEFGSCPNCGSKFHSIDITIGGFIAGLIVGGIATYYLLNE